LFFLYELKLLRRIGNAVMVSIESCENLNFLSLKISKKKFYGLKESIKSENIKKAKESRS
jgi:hypothetical protein